MLVLLYSWLGVVISAAMVLYAVIGVFAPPVWATAVLLFFWWPFFLGLPVACVQPIWLSFLAWGIARIALETWLRYG